MAHHATDMMQPMHTGMTPVGWIILGLIIAFAIFILYFWLKDRKKR